MVDFADVEKAYQRIKDIVTQTPVMTSQTLNSMVKSSVFVKCENFQKIGAFKFRGACNKISQLTEKQRENGVITHSSGNHAQAVALASSIYNIKSVIVMPENAPEVKVNATKGYGAQIMRCKNSIIDREEMAKKLMEENGYTLVHPYNDEKIIAGAGTAAYELFQEVGDLDYMFCPVGGGGLLSGTSIASKGLVPECKVIGVEPEKADDAYRSYTTGKLHPSKYPNTVADGLRTALSELTFKIIRKYVDEILLVTEREIVDAMKFVWERMKIIVEPSGAVPVAGILQCKDHLKGKKIGAILSGGNVDLEDFFQKYYDRITK